jgi:O-antigen ligase
MVSRRSQPAGSGPLWLLVLIGVTIVPCILTNSGHDAMRLPKDTAFLTIGILIVAGCAISLFLQTDAPAILNLRTVPTIAGAVVLWTALDCLFSSNRAISFASLTWVFGAAIFACAIDLLGRERSAAVMAWLLVPAIINVAVFLLQRFHLWNPIRFEESVPEHFRYSALIGNPDDVGSFFVVPVIVVAALFLTDTKRRLLWGTAALLLLAGIVTGTLTPMIACAAGLTVLGFVRSWRVGLIVCAVLSVGAIASFLGFAPLRSRVTEIAAALRSHDYATAFSGRVTPFLAARNMVLEHPIVGVGPGAFRWAYYTYKLDVEAHHPELTRAYSHSFSFAEVHNDHLQIAAESGIVGYAIFALALTVLGAVSIRRPREETVPRGNLARTLALPIAVAIAVLAVAHFPLHLTAVTIGLLYAATLCISWSGLAVFFRTPIRFDLRRHFRIWSTTAGVLAVSLTVFGLWAVRKWYYEPLVCDGIAARTEQSTLRALQLSTSNQFRAASIAHANLNLLAPCVAEQTSNINTYMVAAANYRSLGRLEDAARLYRIALSYDRRPELYYNLGVVELDLRQRQAAVADLLTAIRFSREYMSDLPADVRSELIDLLRKQYPYLLGT